MKIRYILTHFVSGFHGGDGIVLRMSDFSDSVFAVLTEYTVAVAKLFTCMANAFRATEIGPFSASQAAISDNTKNKISPCNSSLYQTAAQINFKVTILPAKSTPINLHYAFLFYLGNHWSYRMSLVCN